MIAEKKLKNFSNSYVHANNSLSKAAENGRPGLEGP